MSDSSPPSPETIGVLFDAARRNLTSTIEFWAKNWPGHVDAVLADGTTALMEAAHHGHKQAIDLLVDLGASVTAKNQRGDSVIMHAVKGGHADVVGLLIKRGASLFDVNADGQHPLAWAEENNRQDLAESLSLAMDREREAIGNAALSGARGESTAWRKPLALTSKKADP